MNLNLMVMIKVEDAREGLQVNCCKQDSCQEEATCRGPWAKRHTGRIVVKCMVRMDVRGPHLVI